MKKILHYLATFVFLIGIDLIWITLVVSRLYQDALGSAMRPSPVIWSAALAWVLIPLGLVLFTVPKSKTASQSLANGALYGLILYGVYDFTNYSILGGYTITLAFADVIWGTVLCGVSSLFSWKIKKFFAM